MNNLMDEDVASGMQAVEKEVKRILPDAQMLWKAGPAAQPAMSEAGFVLLVDSDDISESESFERAEILDSRGSISAAGSARVERLTSRIIAVKVGPLEGSSAH